MERNRTSSVARGGRPSGLRGTAEKNRSWFEEDGYRVSNEYVRPWMVAEGPWQAKRPKQAHVHLMRPRTGELMHNDGSRHAWLDACGLHSILVEFVDDATSLVPAVRFWPTKTITTHTCLLGKVSI